MDGGTGLLIFAFVLVFFGAFFSMSEAAFMSVSKLSIRQMAAGGGKRARRVERILNKKDRLISSVLIGNNLVTILTSSIVTTFAINMAGEEHEALALAIATAATTFVMVVFGDIIPKVMASRYSQKTVLLTARPLAFLMFLLTPVNAALDAFIKKLLAIFSRGMDEEEQSLTEQEVLTMLDMGYEAGVIPEEESQMIDAVFEFRKAHARDVMVPRTDITAISADADYEEVLGVFRTEQFSRLPVYGEDMDDIVGVLNFKDFMLAKIDKDSFKVANHMREPFFSYEFQSTQKLFSQMRRNGAGMAVILDEYGGCAGLVSLEDIVETIMGDIFDEHDDINPDQITCVIPGEEYNMFGGVRIDEFNKLLGTNLASDDYDTMAGYVMGLFGHIPKQGEKITHENFTFIVEEVDKNRIEALKVKIIKYDTLEV